MRSGCVAKRNRGSPPTGAKRVSPAPAEASHPSSFVLLTWSRDAPVAGNPVQRDENVPIHGKRSSKTHDHRRRPSKAPRIATPPPPGGRFHRSSKLRRETGALGQRAAMLRLKRLAHHLWREWIRPLAPPVIGILAAKSALADINFVPSGSMKPTVLEGDVVFVNKLAYDLKIPFTTQRLAEWADPQRGDIVVCISPTDGTRLLKRVVALPGDTIEMRRETLYLNGDPVAYEPLAASEAGIPHLAVSERDAAVFASEFLGQRSHAVMVTPRRVALRSFGPLTVPDDAYFVLGDNRDNSHDSRFIGFVPREQIVGEAKGVFVSADVSRWARPRLDRFFSALK